MACGQASLDPPLRGDCRKGLDDEAAFGEPPMRDGEAARAEASAAPEHEVEIEHAWTPPSARPAAEFFLQIFQALEHFRRIEAAFDQRDGIGEVASRWPVRRIENDRRSIEQAEFLVEPGDRRLRHSRRSPIAPVRSVRPDGDGIEI